MMHLRPARALAVVLAAAGAAVLGWLFGLPELTALGVAAGLALLGSGLWLALRPRAPGTRLHMQPSVVTVDEACSMKVTVDNRNRRESGALRIHGRLGTAGDGILAIASLRPGGSAEMWIGMPTTRRGVFTVDSLLCTVSDPLGWWARTTPVASTATLVVRPRVHALGARELGSGLRRSIVGSGGRGHGGNIDDELVGLRPYVRGDDLRLVHWRTSARRMHPHVVQVEPPARSATVVVVLDNRASVQGPEDFDRAVEAAASIAEHHSRDGHPVRLLTADGYDSGARKASGMPEVLDALAAVQRRTGARLEPALAIAAEVDEACTVLCTGSSAPVELASGSPGARSIVVSTGRGQVLASGPVVRWAEGSPLRDCWDAATVEAPGTTEKAGPLR